MGKYTIATLLACLLTYDVACNGIQCNAMRTPPLSHTHTPNPSHPIHPSSLTPTHPTPPYPSPDPPPPRRAAPRPGRQRHGRGLPRPGLHGRRQQRPPQGEESSVLLVWIASVGSHDRRCIVGVGCLCGVSRQTAPKTGIDARLLYAHAWKRDASATYCLKLYSIHSKEGKNTHLKLFV